MPLTKVTNELFALSSIQPDKLSVGAPTWDTSGNVTAVSFAGDGSSLSNLFPSASVVEVNTNSFLLLPEHNNCTLVFNVSSSVAVEAPSEYTAGHKTGLVQYGTNPVTITGGVNNVFGYNRTAGQYSKAILQFVNQTRGWVSYGDLATSVELYSLSANRVSVNEGSTVTIQLSTFNVSNGLIPYTVSGTINTADLSAGSAGMTGNFNLVGGLASIVFGLSSDNLTEGTELINLQLNNGQASISVPVNDTSNAIPKFTQIAAGNNHSLALSGTDLYATGVNWNGQLGIGSSFNSRQTFTRILSAINNGNVVLTPKFNKISAGYLHSLALSGTDLYATGDDGSGHFSSGVNTNTLTKVLSVLNENQIITNPKFDQIAAGMLVSYALSAGDLYSVGSNENGQLGRGQAGAGNSNNVFTKVLSAISNFDTIQNPKFDKIITKFYGSHALALSGTDLYAVGSNHGYQLGLQTSYPYVSRFTKVTFPANAKWNDGAVAGYSSFALSGTDLYVTGIRLNGDVNSVATYFEHINIPSNAKWSSVAAGAFHFFALSGSDLYTRGGYPEAGYYGEMGLGDTSTRATLTKVTQPQGVKWLSVSPGYNHSLALSEDNNLYSVGLNSFQSAGALGLGNTINRTTFTQVTAVG